MESGSKKKTIPILSGAFKTWANLWEGKKIQEVFGHQ
jgi:hypothetical protein